MPALYIAGDRDFVVAFPGTDQLLANMKTFVPGLRKIQMLPGCGHWTLGGGYGKSACDGFNGRRVLRSITPACGGAVLSS